MRLLTAGSLVRVQLEEPLYRGIAQLVEHRSPKPSAVGSIPTAPANAAIAQSVEHAAVNRRVVGSSPTGGARMWLAATVAVTASLLFKRCGTVWAFSSVG